MSAVVSASDGLGGMRPALRALSALASSGASEESAAARIMVLAMDLVQCDGAGITMVREHGTLKTLVASDPSGIEADELQYALGEGPCYTAALSQQTILSNDVQGDDRWAQWGPMASALGLSSVLSGRMGFEGRRIGAVNLYSHARHGFTTNDMTALNDFAYHAGAALRQISQVANLRASMEGRTVIGQAQGVLMQRFGLSADNSFAVLKRYSQQNNVKVRALAEFVTERRQLPETWPPPVVDADDASAAEPAPGLHIYSDDQADIFFTGDGLRMLGELDLANVGTLSGMMLAAHQSVADGQLRLDLTGVTFVDVAGVRTLTECAARIAPIVTRLIVRHGSVAHKLSTVATASSVESLLWEVLP